MNYLAIMVIIALILCICYAVSDPIVAKVIAGEAAGEGYEGMYAVACVIQNRVEMTGRTPKEVVMQKKQFASLNNPKLTLLYIPIKPCADYLATRIGTLDDVTGGATCFENIKRFGKPCWAKRMIETCRIGRHVFYREK